MEVNYLGSFLQSENDGENNDYMCSRSDAIRSKIEIEKNNDESFSQDGNLLSLWFM